MEGLGQRCTQEVTLWPEASGGRGGSSATDPGGLSGVLAELRGSQSAWCGHWRAEQAGAQGMARSAPRTGGCPAPAEPLTPQNKGAGVSGGDGLFDKDSGMPKWLRPRGDWTGQSRKLSHSRTAQAYTRGQ